MAAQVGRGAARPAASGAVRARRGGAPARQRARRGRARAADTEATTETEVDVRAADTEATTETKLDVCVVRVADTQTEAAVDVRASATEAASALGGALGKLTGAVAKELKSWGDGSWAPKTARAWGKNINLSKSEEAIEEGRAAKRAFEREQLEFGAAAGAMFAAEALAEQLKAEFDDAGSGEAGEDAPDWVPESWKANAAGANKPMSGRELAHICYSKYSMFYEMSISHTLIGASASVWVSLCLYSGHLGQQSFPLSEDEYLEKCECVAAFINELEMADFTRAFFRERIYPRRGLPSRPRVDTAVSLRYNQAPNFDEAWARELLGGENAF